MKNLLNQLHESHCFVHGTRAQETLSLRNHWLKVGSLKWVIVAISVVVTLPAAAQLDHTMTPIDVPEQANAIELDTGTLPEAEVAESWHAQYGSRFARNVRVATLTPFLPDSDNATGAAVVVAPGGGFRTLSMDNEGWEVASALAEQGIAAFVLKYRLNQTPASMAGFQRSMEEMFSNTGQRPPRPPRPQPSEMKERLAPQLEDSKAAFELIHERSDEWGIDKERIGMIGFSAGAMLSMATTLVGDGPTSAFIANIYGPISAVKAPDDAPPLFITLAADAPFFANSNFGLIENWHAAGKSIEFHFYEQGGHGFGMYQKETTSTG